MQSCRGHPRREPADIPVLGPGEHQWLWSSLLQPMRLLSQEGGGELCEFWTPPSAESKQWGYTYLKREALFLLNTLRNGRWTPRQLIKHPEQVIGLTF